MSFYDAIKDVAKIAREAGNTELYAEILEVQEKAIELQNENNELKSQINKMKENSDISSRLKFKKQVYYLSIDSIKEEGPFCSGCWDNYNKLVRLHIMEPEMTLAQCPICKISCTEYK